MSPEQLLVVAREFCRYHPSVRMERYWALNAAAAAAGARVEGVFVHGSAAAAAKALSETIRAVQPLSGRNAEFAEVCGEVYRRLAEG